MGRFVILFTLWRILSQQRQLDIENRCGIKRWRISEYEAGRLKLSSDELQRLAELTGLPPERLQQPIESDMDIKIQKQKKEM
jgi:transcriptional regulator with XRE-family HTH domain